MLSRRLGVLGVPPSTHYSSSGGHMLERSKTGACFWARVQFEPTAMGKRQKKQAENPSRRDGQAKRSFRGVGRGTGGEDMPKLMVTSTKSLLSSNSPGSTPNRLGTEKVPHTLGPTTCHHRAKKEGSTTSPCTYSISICQQPGARQRWSRERHPA